MTRKTTKTTNAVSLTASKKIPVFYALGLSLIEARVEALDTLPVRGATIILKERSLHTRSGEHCTRPCCAVDTTRQYKVTAVNVLKTRTKDALMRVVNARPWDEKTCRRHEWCQLFDSYTLAGYLGQKADDFGAPVKKAVIIDIKVTA